MKRFSGAWRLGRGQAEFLKALRQIVGAVVMVAGATKLLVTVAVAGGHQRIVDAAGGILQSRSGSGADGWSAGIRRPGEIRWRSVARLCSIDINSVMSERVERPGIDDLFAVRIDHLDGLAGGDVGSLAAAGGDGDGRCGHFVLQKHASVGCQAILRARDAARAGVALRAGRIILPHSVFVPIR